MKINPQRYLFTVCIQNSTRSLHRTPFSNRDGSWRTEQKVHWRITRALFSLSHIAHPYLQLSQNLKTWILRSLSFSECMAAILWGKSLGFRDIVSLQRSHSQLQPQTLSETSCCRQKTLGWLCEILCLSQRNPFGPHLLIPFGDQLQATSSASPWTASRLQPEAPELIPAQSLTTACTDPLAD